MSLGALPLTDSLALLGWLAAIALLAPALWQAARIHRAELVEGSLQNALLGFAVLSALMHALEAPSRTGVGLHLVGAGLATAMFGWRLALPVLAASAALGVLLGERGDWQTLGLAFTLGAALPALLASACQEAMRRWLPRHPMIFILGHGFFAPGLAAAAAGASATSALVLTGTIASAPGWGELLPYALLLAWGEAFLSGTLLAIFVIYRPRWVPTFDDRIYLRH